MRLMPRVRSARIRIGSSACAERLLDQDEDDEQDHAGDEGDEGDRVEPAGARLGRVGEAVDDADQAEGAGERAGQVEPAGLALGLGQVARREEGDEQADRHVDEEGPAPVHLGEGATEDEADRGAGAGHGGVDAHGAVALLAGGEGRGDQGERGRGGDRGADALQDARADHHRLVLGEPAEQRGDREHGDADDEHPAAAEDVAEPAAEQQQAAEGERVGVHHPRQAAPAEAEVGLDVGQRDVHDGAVEHDHQLGAADDGEGEAEPAGSRRCRLGRRGRELACGGGGHGVRSSRSKKVGKSRGVRRDCGRGSRGPPAARRCR